MTDLTDQDLETAREFIAHVRKYRAVTGPNAVTAVRVLEALMPAPAPTLAEELRELGVLLEEEGGAGAKSTVWARDLAVRAEQIEQERDEARAEVKRGREIIRKHKERADRIAGERDEVLAEVERLTAENEKLRRTDNYREFWGKFLTVQKGVEINAETPTPADVKPGEAWLVECRGERRNAMKDNSLSIEWNTVNADGWPVVEDSEDITLVSRLVPELHADTTPHHPEGTATQ